MSSAQQQTVATYHQLMQVNAMAHFLRIAREVGLLDQLKLRQHTTEELCEALSLAIEPTRLLLDALVSMGVVERYRDDFALSQAAQLLCQFDQDFGDATWDRLDKTLRQRVSDSSAKNTETYFDHQAATQWVHTPAAMQAAEVLDIGGEGQSGTKILDLGCGSAVWSCAMAHRDATAMLTVVDHAGAIESATSTATSIDLLGRLEAITGDPMSVAIPESTFDLAVVAQRTAALGDVAAAELIRRAFLAIKPGGRVAVIDLFRGPDKSSEKTGDPAGRSYARPTFAESLEAMRICIRTQQGRLRTLHDAKELLISAGLEQVQFAYLSASRLNLGIAVGTKTD